MKPVLLTMTAFGPYAATETVDFREATDAGLFGIYGATGSGKSSIFNAMTFALFGEGAKREQPIGTMRSGHADADRRTEVSLLFELGGKRYFVRRQPDQTRPKKRGEGETSDAHKAWLFDATLVPVDDVTVDNCGTVLAETKVGEARNAFEARLAELELDQASYDLGCADIGGIHEHAERINTHRKEVAITEAQATAAQDAIRGMERPDVGALAAVRDEARAERLRTRQVAADAAAARKVLDDLLASLRDQLTRLDRLEEETGPLRELAEAFAGENPLRTPLETYAIGAMFDHVLDAANLRLDPMTGGRYRFEREVQAVGGRTKRGLDVRVHDVQTGRLREVSTLSGGETFIAALSLALGLSDVVEMNHGRIRLDTIFIDEGFGSLDTENDGGTLDRVLQVLQEIVGRNRAVGLISHVPLVQQAVPNGFSIVKGIGGSRVERRAM